MNGSKEYAIAVDGLTKDYGDLRAVNDLSFTVRQGEVFAFLGPNGAGKTTAVEIIETVRTSTSGTVRVLGMDVASRKRDIIPRIGVLPQGFTSFDRITVAESIRYYAHLFGLAATDVDGLMDLTELGEMRDVQFKHLSGGLKQRLGIAIALVNDPEVVFLDEPTTGLDPHARRSVWSVLHGLKDKGKTVFLTTHYIEEAELLADTVAIISRGRIVALDSPARLTATHSDRLCVTLTPGDAASIDLVQRMGFTPARTLDQSIDIPVRTTGDVLGILAAIRKAGLPAPLGLEVRKQSLEEVFLKLTAQPPAEGSHRGAQ